MFETGLASVTFRDSTPREIVDLVVKAGQKTIEWSSDPHVPPGDLAQANEVVARMREAGLRTAAYGSYYRIGCTGKSASEFEPVLETAQALDAPIIRVWAGDRASKGAPESWWNTVFADARRITELAKSANITIAMEFHGNTLNDTPEGTRRLLNAVDDSHFRTYWRPDHQLDLDKRLASLKILRRKVVALHVFDRTDGKRHPLEAGANAWTQYLMLLQETEQDYALLLEFVEKDFSPYYVRDAETLANVITGLCKAPR